MITGAEIGLGIRALKSAFDIAKEAKDLTDTTAMRSKIIEMQSLIMDAQASAIDAREAHSEQANRISALEAEVARFKAWDGEKVRYELKDVGGGTFAYMLKPSERGSEPPHWLCPNCFEDGKKSIFLRKNQGYTPCTCPRCSAVIGPQESPKWLG